MEWVVGLLGSLSDVNWQKFSIQTLNSLSLGALLFLLAAGFSLIFGLMRIANLMHGSLYMLGAYVGISVLKYVPNLWLAAIIGWGGMRGVGGPLGRPRRSLTR